MNKQTNEQNNIILV